MRGKDRHLHSFTLRLQATGQPTFKDMIMMTWFHATVTIPRFARATGDDNAGRQDLVPIGHLGGLHGPWKG